MSLLKALVIAVLMIFAVFFLAMGLGIPVPHMPQGVPARDIPIGILLVLAGIVVSRFWSIPQNEEKLIEDFRRSRKHPR